MEISPCCLCSVCVFTLPSSSRLLLYLPLPFSVSCISLFFSKPLKFKFSRGFFCRDQCLCCFPRTPSVFVGSTFSLISFFTASSAGIFWACVNTMKPNARRPKLYADTWNRTTCWRFKYRQTDARSATLNIHSEMDWKYWSTLFPTMISSNNSLRYLL